MKGNQKNAQKFALTALAASILLLSESSYALQALDDHQLSRIDGQDGIDISTTYSQADIDQLYWEDTAGLATGTVEQTLRATASAVKIRDTNLADGLSLGTRFKVDMGSNGTQAGINLDIISNPSTISVDNFAVCDTAGTPVCDTSGANPYAGKVGGLAIQSASPINILFKTRDGLFNSTEQATVNIGLNNINIYTGLKLTPSATTQNQLILKNLNFNFNATGVIYVDDNQGLMLETRSGIAAAIGTPAYNTLKSTKTTTPSLVHGYADFSRATDPDQTGAATGTYQGKSAGLNLEFMTKANAAVDPTNPVYSLTGAKGLIRVGASGRMVNSYLQVRGISANGIAAPTDNNVTNTHVLNNILGYASNSSTTGTGANNTVIGSNGIGLRLRGEFTAQGDAMLGGDNTKATTLEIGGAGTNTFGFEFGELQPLVVDSVDRAYFDSGNVYLNLANTRHLRMPENSVLRTARFGGTTNTFLTDSSDYIQQIHNLTNNPYSVVAAIRGADFQAISKRGRFTSSSGVSAGNAIAPADGLTNQWGLGLPFYNLNANLAMYATSYTGDVFTLNNTTNVVSKSTVSGTQRLGLALALSVEGKNSDGSKTTSIMLIDGGDRDLVTAGIQPTNYYIGLRNIDMLLSGRGSVGVENGNLNVTLPNLLMVMAAEIAAGYLPGAKYKSTGANVPLNNFNLKTDVLFGLKIKMLGDMSFALVPNNEISATNGNRLSIIGEYRLTDGAIQLSDPIQDSMIGLDRMSGLVGFNNAIVINKDNVGFNLGFNFNPNKSASDVFRVKDINFYPPLSSTNNRGQRLGEMVMTGGRLNAEMTLKPRN
jgi:hypothetical protein